jgi:hypothetical protein
LLSNRGHIVAPFPSDATLPLATCLWKLDYRTVR